MAGFVASHDLRQYNSISPFWVLVSGRDPSVFQTLACGLDGFIALRAMLVSVGLSDLAHRRSDTGICRPRRLDFIAPGVVVNNQGLTDKYFIANTVKTHILAIKTPPQ